MRLSIAFRNTFRNARRTALNVGMIAAGVSALILFRGFSSHIIHDLREATIEAETGHLQLATPVFWDKSGKSPKDALLPDYTKLIDALIKVPHVRAASGRIGFYGLVSTGEQAFSARGISIDPLAEKEKMESLRIISGERLKEGNVFQVLLGSGLAKTIHISAGQTATVLSYTYDGVVNALDLEVAGIFNTGVSEFDDTSFIVPLSAAQKLLDTDQVEQIIVGIDETERTDEVRATVRPVVAAINPSVVIKTWQELSIYYQKTVSFLHTQNRVLEVIILSLCLLGVLNTIGMSIFERAGEIGTLRALGDTERAVLGQFVVEGAILGLVGATTGVVAGTLFAWLVNLAQIPIVVPGASVPLKIRIDLYLASYFQAVLVAFSSSIVAAFLPALRASRMNIVDALRRNI